MYWCCQSIFDKLSDKVPSLCTLHITAERTTRCTSVPHPQNVRRPQLYSMLLHGQKNTRLHTFPSHRRTNHTLPNESARVADAPLPSLEPAPAATLRLILLIAASFADAAPSLHVLDSSFEWKSRTTADPSPPSQRMRPARPFTRRRLTLRRRPLPRSCAPLVARAEVQSEQLIVAVARQRSCDLDSLRSKDVGGIASHFSGASGTDHSFIYLLSLCRDVKTRRYAPLDGVTYTRRFAIQCCCGGYLSLCAENSSRPK